MLLKHCILIQSGETEPFLPLLPLPRLSYDNDAADADDVAIVSSVQETCQGAKDLPRTADTHIQCQPKEDIE